jgi:hypothetical protein
VLLLVFLLLLLLLLLTLLTCCPSFTKGCTLPTSLAPIIT